MGVERPGLVAGEESPEEELNMTAGAIGEEQNSVINVENSANQDVVNCWYAFVPPIDKKRYYAKNEIWLSEF